MMGFRFAPGQIPPNGGGICWGKSEGEAVVQFLCASNGKYSPVQSGAIDFVTYNALLTALLPRRGRPSVAHDSCPLPISDQKQQIPPPFGGICPK